MGNAKSKNKLGIRTKGKRRKHGGSSQRDVPSVGPDDVHDDEFEDIELKLLRRAISRNPDCFVLNNLMMCVQFFGNYEEDIEHIRNTLVSSCETDLNNRLPSQKHVLLPDVLQEYVARNVGFTSTRQTLRPTIEPLQPVRIYMVHDDIDVTEQNYPAHYSSVNDTVTYNMLLKPSEHQGYVKLQLLDEMPGLKNASTEEDLSSIAEDDYEFYSDGESAYGPKSTSRETLSRRAKKSDSQNYHRIHSRSLPDLQQDEVVYEEERCLSRYSIYDGHPAQQVKAESDYEYLSSNDERRIREQRAWSKRELAAKLMNPRGGHRNQRQQSRSKHGSQNNRSPASSTSSGYRSGNYAVDSDTECSYNANYKRRSCNGSIGCASNGYGSTHRRESNGNESVHGCGSHGCNGVHVCNPVPACNAHGCNSHYCAASHNYQCHAPQANGMSQSSEVTPNDAPLPRLSEQLKAPKPAPLPQTISSQTLHHGIPRKCFKKVTYTSEGKIYDPREEKKQLLNSKQRRIRLALRRRNYDVYYVSSAEFMMHFINLFVDRYANALNFDRDTIEDVKPDGCVIYCDKVMVSHTSRYSRVESYEVIPTAWLQWPECAQEWLDRPRSTWPDYDDIKKVKEFGCYIVPEGFQPKNGINPTQNLQWQLTFPAAERYLETCMTHTQVQVYLLALMLHKTFIRPVFDTIFGLTTAHIRNKLFWMIEENDSPSKWPENRSGECLLKLLNLLYCSISQNEPTLPDYFVRNRNLFQKVPSEHLLHTQKQLKRIIENPVMYVFHAMENVRHSQKFFPRPNYEMLLRILTVDALALVNPALDQHVFRPISPPTVNDDNVIIEDGEVEERTYRPGGFWDSAKLKKDKNKLYSATPVTNKTLISPRKATDSIIEISVRCAELEGPRLSALLDFFVRHFIKMAERCHQYRAHTQKAVYLDQADRLAILLSEQSRYRGDARAYRDKIKALRNRVTSSRTPIDDPPETPKRNAEAPIYVAPLKDRFARESMEQSTAQSIRSDSVDYVQQAKDYHRDDRMSETTRADVYKPLSEDSYDTRLGLSTTSKDRESYRSTNYSLNRENARSPDPIYSRGSSMASIDRQSSSSRKPVGDRHSSSSSSMKVSSPGKEDANSRKMVNGENSRKLASPVREISNSRTSSSSELERLSSKKASNGRTASSPRKQTPPEQNSSSKKTMPPLREPSTSKRESEGKEAPRIVSLIEDQNESFLTETTYI